MLSDNIVTDKDAMADEAALYCRRARRYIEDENWRLVAAHLLKRCKELDMALQSLTPGGSEYVGDPQRCVQRARDNVETYRQLWIEARGELAKRAESPNAL
jgi:hypothetical protein